jgi:hypothetical protein
MATRYASTAQKSSRETLGRSAATGRFVLKPVKKPGMSISVKDVQKAIERIRAEGLKS